MDLRIVAGTSVRGVAERLVAALDQPLTTSVVERFPDGELRPIVDAVRGDDVYVVQSTGPPVSDHLVELLLLLDACRRGGADRLTAVVPYFAYARQDRRNREGQALGARLVADLIFSAGADRLVVIDPHTTALEAMFSGRTEMLTAVPTLARAMSCADDDVVVAPDLGAAKLAERYGALLGLPVAVVRKTRISGTEVRVEELVGDVEDRRPIIVDDMIATGGTIEAAITAVLDRGARPDVTVAATHGLLVDPASERLRSSPVRQIFVTDTVGSGAPTDLPLVVASCHLVLAEAIRRLHEGRPRSRQDG
jgi:ribose-phosphate pyrophosphokinase